MDKDGLSQIKERLGRLRSTAKILTSSAPLAEQESAWLDFLQYHGTIYSKLEQASKATQESKNWFNTKKAERKKDGLLVYLHHARNAGEHTILRASTQAVFSVSGTAQSGGSMGISFDNNGKPFATGSGLGGMKVHKNEIMLQAAKDRGVYYKPPRSHLGQPIEGDTAREVAILALKHAETMIEDAKSFSSPA